MLRSIGVSLFNSSRKLVDNVVFSGYICCSIGCYFLLTARYLFSGLVDHKQLYYNMSLEKCKKIAGEDFPVFKKSSIDYLQTAQKTYLNFALQLHSELKTMFEQQHKKNTQETKSTKSPREIESKSYCM
jgi:hypothetical protein